MNRERLTILRDHLASLPDEQVDMALIRVERECGTVACIMGWAEVLFPEREDSTARHLGLTDEQGSELYMPTGYGNGIYTRTDAIAAIQSMLDSPDDDALPVWPERA